MVRNSNEVQAKSTNKSSAAFGGAPGPSFVINANAYNYYDQLYIFLKIHISYFLHALSFVY